MIKIETIINKLSIKYDDFNWWIPNNLKLFDEELSKEIAVNHPLYNKSMKAIAKNDRNDSVLFESKDKYYVVHLTWSYNNNSVFLIFKEINSWDLEFFLENDYNF